ncbi:hypothetical protein SAMN04488003_1561 [Loktanella fryxellensis]|jgi:hypothetical protein|uniref:Short C-terminal domain-containing protein n=1 Tax=Loktanella fryxellensis TaxID=245187 RepID=A0A1H8K862_9RHOB|nr:SHOCT domain-containing protein [Loktanella fryxellensis]SEN89180.1 hypothetical protein SAMN04488003_1561 [Loktanella fryxellensis]
MKNEPLIANEHYKIFLFLLLLIPSILLLVGIIPALALAIGYYLMKKNRDFSSIEASVKALNIYWKLIAVLTLIWAAVVALIFVVEIRSNPGFWGNPNEVDFGILAAWTVGLLATAAGHIFMAEHLYSKPLRNHSEWVVANGIFSNQLKTTPQASPKNSIDILQSQKLKQYSVADELVKWAKLKEDGHISNDEFDEARSKLLGRS